MSNPTEDDLKAIAIELAVLDQPAWFPKEYPPTAFWELTGGRSLWRIVSCIGQPVMFIDHERVQKVWHDRQGLQSLRDRVTILEALVAKLVEKS